MGLGLGHIYQGVAGGGGFLDADIFVRSVGDWDRSPGGGTEQLAHDLPRPPLLEADDALFVIVQGSTSLDFATGNPEWILITQGIFNRIKIYFRTADGTSDDDFVMPTNSIALHGMMACIGNKRSSPPNAANLQQGGFGNMDSDTTWDVSFPPGQPVSLSANTTWDPWAFVLLWIGRQTATDPPVQPTMSGQNPDGMEVLGEDLWLIEGSGSFDPTFWVGFYFQYLTVSVQYDSYNITYAPVQTLTNFSQHTRWRIQ